MIINERKTFSTEFFTQVSFLITNWDLPFDQMIKLNTHSTDGIDDKVVIFLNLFRVFWIRILNRLVFGDGRLGVCRGGHVCCHGRHLGHYKLLIKHNFLIYRCNRFIGAVTLIQNERRGSHFVCVGPSGFCQKASYWGFGLWGATLI